MEEVLKEFKEYAKARALIDPTIDPQSAHSHNQSTEAGSKDNGGAEVVEGTAGSENIINDVMDEDCEAAGPVRPVESPIKQKMQIPDTGKGKRKMQKRGGRGKGRWHHPYAPTQATYNNSPVTYNITHNIHYHKD